MIFLKNAVRNFLLQSGYFVSQVADYEKVKDFFDLIKANQASCKLVRIGGRGDGGYLVPDDFDGIDECFSPGVSVIADFEKELVAQGMLCHLADFSVDRPPFDHNLIDFEKKFLGIDNDEIFIRLDTWVSLKEKSGKDCILQMDIEGAEYRVILDSSDEVLKKFRIIIIEFHHLNKMFEMFGFDLIDLTFRKLLKQFNIVHIHPNNYRKPVVHYGYSIPPLMEITFLRKDRVIQNISTGVSQHELDEPNVSEFPDVALPACWRR